jgi:hypothetical protein
MEPTSVTQSATLRQTSGDEQLRQSQPEKGSNTSEGRGEGGTAVFPSVRIKQQENINFSFKLWKTGTETYEILATVYGSYAKYCTQSSNDWEGSRWGTMILNVIQGTVGHQLLKSKKQLRSVVRSVLAYCHKFTNW